jgi:hypothetical protein
MSASDERQTIIYDYIDSNQKKTEDPRPHHLQDRQLLERCDTHT